MDQPRFKETVIHLSWIIGFLTITIVLILAANLGARQDLKDTLSFAVSFASLILAIIAIGQALFASNSSMNSQMMLQNASSQIEATVAQLGNVSDRLPSLIDTMQASISSHTDNLAQSVDRMGDTVAIVRERQDLLLEKQMVLDTGSSVKKDETAASSIDDFAVGDLTNGQYIALYLILKAFEAEKVLNVEEAVRPYEANYYSGVLSTLKVYKYVGMEAINGLFRIKDLGKLENHVDKLREIFENSTNAMTKDIKSKIDAWSAGTANVEP